MTLQSSFTITNAHTISNLAKVEFQNATKNADFQMHPVTLQSSFYIPLLICWKGALKRLAASTVSIYVYSWLLKIKQNDYNLILDDSNKQNEPKYMAPQVNNINKPIDPKFNILIQDT